MEKEQHKEPGYVYILTNPSFREDWVKIGKSSRPVDVRSKELDNTAVPLPFEIYATFRTVKYNEVEKLVHKYIDRFTHLRIRQNREFFNVSPKVALDIFRDIAQAIDDAVITEYNENKPEECHNKPIQDIAKRKGKREKFTINGKGEFYKNGCMVEVIRQYIKERSLTYKEIETFFDERIPNLIMSVDRVKKQQQDSVDKSKNTRWHFKSPLTSSDGVDFLVSTQVGEGCRIDFNDIVSLSAELGYNIEKLD